MAETSVKCLADNYNVWAAGYGDLTGICIHAMHTPDCRSMHGSGQVNNRTWLHLCIRKHAILGDDCNYTNAWLYFLCRVIQMCKVSRGGIPTKRQDNGW